jgi:diaminobutyrate-2-oxoglutarate transaminase
MQVFADHESSVRSYCRRIPAVFSHATGSHMYDTEGHAYIDFLCGAGALNYGHNNPVIKRAVLDYMLRDGVAMSLDLHTEAKAGFIRAFHGKILAPRGLHYKLQFTSPSGTSVIESAVKLARKVTGRQNIVCFTNAFHGMSGTSLSLTGSSYHRQAIAQPGVTRFPYDGYLGSSVDSIACYRKLLTDPSSGIDLPAAVVVECVQGEGGVNVASNAWLQALRALTRELGILLIVDDIQTGCGRSGAFFGFERAAIKPDMVCLSKSIGGIGFPFAVLLFDPLLDVWSPGEDNGTFRGNNLAFVAAAAMIDEYWSDDRLEREIKDKEQQIGIFFKRMMRLYPEMIVACRGVGLMQGMVFADPALAADIVGACFKSRLIIETCGPRDEVVKLMPSLLIEDAVLAEGLHLLEQAIALAHCGALYEAA